MRKKVIEVKKVEDEICTLCHSAENVQKISYGTENNRNSFFVCDKCSKIMAGAMIQVSEGKDCIKKEIQK